MTIIHIVLFKLKSSLDEAAIKTFCSDMIELKEQCIHPESNKPYIVRSSGGKDNSPEGVQGGMTHGFVVEFGSVADRDYYVDKDAAHKAFQAKHRPEFDDVRVVDYEPGVY